MSNADKLFYELGYEKIQDDKSWIDFKKRNINITFNLNDKFVEATQLYGGEYLSKKIYMEELKAINMKCEEMRLVR